MTTYVKLTDFASKDALASGNPAKLGKGVEIDTEFTAIAAADATSVKTTGNQSVAGVKTFSDTTDASSSTVGGTIVSGGLAVAKKIYVGTDLNIGGHITTEGVTATGATGTGKLVFDTSPTLVTPALGTPASGTLTSCTGLPISTGVSGLGTGVATALAVNVGTAGAPVVNGGALGTPSSGTVTNLTGTASININGTVGATTPTTGAFTTLSATNTITSTVVGAATPSFTATGGAATRCIALSASGMTTAETFVRLQNTGGGVWLGIESSAGGAFTGGVGSAYATVLANFTATPIELIANSVKVVSFASTGITATTNILSSSATGGIGYTTGAGGTVTQGTSRTTGVTLNKVSGAITMFSAAGSTSAATFTVTNSAVAATDTIVLNQKSGTNLYVFIVTAVAAGSFNITFYTTGGTATDAPVINFNVIKGVAA